MRSILQRLAGLLTLLVASGVLANAKERDREALKKVLAELVKRSPLSASRISVQVYSLDRGEVVYAENADELVNPASNVKLVTAAAALARLGLEYRYETEFLTDAELKHGKAKLLFVRGKGDPSITTERLYNFVSELLHTGLREVQDIVVDDSWFDADRVPPGYDQEKSDRSYMAPPGAVSLNWNAVGVYLRPGEGGVGSKAVVELEPDSEYFVVDNLLVTGNRKSRRFSVTSKPDQDQSRQRIEVRGSIPNERGSWSVWKKIDAPPLYFGYTLKQLLKERGVKVKGRVRLGTVPPTAKILYVGQSETLDLVLKRLNKHSSNFVAEQLLKTMGAELKGPPGTTLKGIEVVEEYLEREVGIGRGTYVMKNGSGLNDTNRFSAAQMVKVLKHMYERFPLAPEYLSALGVAAKDGTLKYRFEGSEAAGRLRAKTGTLENVSALSGYVQAVGGEKFAFSVMVNDFPGRASAVIPHIDALGAALAALGSGSTPADAALALTGVRSVVGPIDEVKARVRTYLALGRQGDKRNIPFLRTAWRNEKDPAVRAVVAESLYQSDPQDYLGARTLLDSFSAGDEVYGRLRQVARELSIEVPGVMSIVELAASGNLDALSRLIELARASLADEQAQEDIADALAEVARTAPDELLVSMKSAMLPEREAALSLLAKGMVKAADPEHPFWPVLKKTMGGVDAELAAFAREAETALSLRIAEEKAPKGVDVPEGGSRPPDGAAAEARPGG